MSNIGLNVIEVDGPATPAIRGAAASIAGFAISTPRGPVTGPGSGAVLVTSFAQFVERFGGPDAGSDGPLVVQGFFANGGRRAWICRVTGSGTNAPKPAAAKLTRGTGPNQSNVLELSGGARGVAEPGTWANGVQVALKPSFASGLRESSTDVSEHGTALASVRGLSVGAPVVVRDGTHSQQVTIAAIDASTGAVTWTENLTSANEYGAKTTVSTTDFDLAVTAPSGGERVTVEEWSRLTLRRDASNYVVTVLNDLARGSKWIKVTDARAANLTGAEPLPDTPTGELTGGTAGTVGSTDYTGDQGKHTGLFAFDPLSVQLIGLDTSDTDVLTAALSYCETRGDCMVVGAVPEGTTVETAAEFGGGLQGKKVYGAIYAPWVEVLDPTPGSTGRRLIPPTGHVMGVYARTEETRGIHKAPAGDEARLLGVLDVEYPISDADHTFLVRDGSVNGVRVAPGAGIVVDASRTLSTDTRWLYVNVRLLFNYVKSSLRDGLRWVRQEPNRTTLWDAVKFGTVRPFLLGLWRQGAFGTGEPDDVFTIVCDETNNPPTEVDKGNFNLQVTFWPSKPAETITIIVGQQPAGSSAAEA